MPHIALLRPADGEVTAGDLRVGLAASGLGVSELSPAELTEDAAFDLVLATSSAYRKTTSHPTLLWLDEPLSAVQAHGRFSNLCSFDAYGASRESGRLLRHLAVSLDKPLIEPISIEGTDKGAAVLRALKAFQAAESAQSQALGRPCINVILRTGGRAAATVRRAVDSLRRQTAGSVRLIVVRHGALDVEAAIGAPEGALAEIEVIEAPGANRGRALVAGLAAVRAPFFSVLDDDDYLLNGHFAGLLTALNRSDAARRLAYCDILKRQEGPPDPMGASAFSMFREGVAAGPITAILERFTSHCFLATAATLAPVRFDHWDLATAEDSLLVAALLRHVQEAIRSPSATAVYSQGADPASAFEDHPQRRADEAALHAETFAWRADIEARFPAEAPDPLPFLAAAIRRWASPLEDAEPARVVPVDDRGLPSAKIASGSEMLGGAFGGADTVVVRVPLTPGRAMGEGLYFEAELGGVQIGPQGAWDVGLRLDVSDYLVPGCGARAAVVLRAVGSDVAVGLLDGEGVLVERTLVPAAAVESAIEVKGASPSVSAVVVQAGATGAQACRVSEVRMVYALSDLAVAFDLGEEANPATVVERLGVWVASQVSGRPEIAPTDFVPIDYRSARSVFRHVFEDGPFRDGARRVMGTGAKPWDYFAQVHIPRSASAGGWVRVELADSRERFTVFLVDDRFTTRVSEAIDVHADKERIELWLPAPDRDSYLIFQSGAAPRDSPLVLVGVSVAT